MSETLAFSKVIATLNEHWREIVAEKDAVISSLADQLHRASEKLIDQNGELCRLKDSGDNETIAQQADHIKILEKQLETQAERIGDLEYQLKDLSELSGGVVASKDAQIKKLEKELESIKAHDKYVSDMERYGHGKVL